jgi:hypothetical protein
MSINTNLPIQCDICGIAKQSTNHWYRMAIVDGMFVSTPLKDGQRPMKGEKHACGAAHAGAFYLRYLTTGNLEMEMHPEPAA